jgi:uncharacterized protein (TIGR02646 family)
MTERLQISAELYVIHIKRPNPPPSYSDYSINKIRKNQEITIRKWLNAIRSKGLETQSKLTRELLSLKVQHGRVPNFKAELNQCFNHKCPFCETKLDADNTKVFFYRPPERVQDEPDKRYYRWLMWEWSNLYPACEDCYHKKRFAFPVSNRRANLGVHKKSTLRDEKPFLLDPCDDYPEEHLDFHEDGSVTAKPNSKRGEKTIEILDLNREGLQVKRREEAARLKQAWEEEMQKVSASAANVKEILWQGYCLDDQPFAGMKRQLLTSWIEDLPPDKPSPVPPQSKKRKIGSKVKLQKLDKRLLSIFLCHTSGDKPLVRGLNRRLVADGFDAWLDEEKLMPGQDWDLEIRKAVRSSDTVVVCLSNGSITKEGYVQKEIRLALDIADEKPEGTIFLIPVRLEECEVPDRLRKWQWVNLFDEAGYGKLIRALRTHAQIKGLLGSRNDSAVGTEP